jgi:hypothetical protein
VSFSCESLDSNQASYHWWLWEQLYLNRIFNMGVTRSIVDNCGTRFIYISTHTPTWKPSTSILALWHYSGDLIRQRFWVPTPDPRSNRFAQWHWIYSLNQGALRRSSWRLASRIWIHNYINQWKIWSYFNRWGWNTSRSRWRTREIAPVNLTLSSSASKSTSN